MCDVVTRWSDNTQSRCSDPKPGICIYHAKVRAGLLEPDQNERGFTPIEQTYQGKRIWHTEKVPCLTAI